MTNLSLSWFLSSALILLVFVLLHFHGHTVLFFTRGKYEYSLQHVMCLCHALASGTRSLGCCSNLFYWENKEKYPIDLVIFLKANNPKVRLNLVIFLLSTKLF